MTATGKNIKEIKKESANKRTNFMKEETKKYLENVDSLHISISEGNVKTGNLVPSISLRPILDCPNCKCCSKLCYDLRNDCIWSNVMKTRAKNAAIFQRDSKRYFDEISAKCKFYISFRWHVGGDIVNRAYFDGMVRVAKENPNTKFLAFTKNFKVVNEYLSEGKEIPQNFKVIFSGWVNQKMENPYNLPTSHPIFADGQTSAHDGAKLCTGNCSECLVQNRNCWNLKKGEEVVFIAH